MNVAALIDPTSGAIVVGGTLLATVLRCGPFACLGALRALAARFVPAFDPSAARSELAIQIQQIQQDGLLRAEPHHFGDAEFDDVTDALIGSRSLKALLARHQAHRRQRQLRNGQAVSTLVTAAELSPVFGLVGTLVSLSQLSLSGQGAAGIAASIPMAILTTLYGLLCANLVFQPLARLIERRAAWEEDERQKLFDWLADQAMGPAAQRPSASGHQRGHEHHGHAQQRFAT